MDAREAVARRIQALCSQRDIAVNALANQCGVAPSTIYSMLNEKSKNPGVMSIQKICDGLDISVREGELYYQVQHFRGKKSSYRPLW